jgi:hypothetical protein
MMDMTYCTNESCPRTERCKRFVGNIEGDYESNYLSQAYFEHQYGRCEYFIELCEHFEKEYKS